MLEYRGNTYQTGNATPNDARKVLKSLVRAGAVKGSITKGANYGDLDILCGELRKRKVYFVTFIELDIINADVIMKAKDGNPMFFYEI